jgi:SAM-dependent methyltransferase
VDACTIIAKNYLALARVLAKSFLDTNPGSAFTVLVIDEWEGYLNPAVERFQVLSPSDIGCEAFDRMSGRYDVLELSTAVKPWLLRHLLDRGAPTVTYLDPDIQVFSSLEYLHEQAVAHGLVLTPHNTRPIPDDNKKPSQIDIMMAGVYNLGYVSLGAGEETESLLDWWCERLVKDCRVDPSRGYFVDQRWFDLAPGFVNDHAIVRRPEYNIAYWNLHSRNLAHVEDEGYTVDGRPLAFFHFSGFDPTKPNIMSKHQGRIALKHYPVAAKLCREYAAATLDQGYKSTRHWPYTYNTLANGDAMSPILRAVYAQGMDAGILSSSPFQQPGCTELLKWAGGQDPKMPEGINRVLGFAYGLRTDLQAVFPDLVGLSRPAYLDWALEHGEDELRLPVSLLRTETVLPNPQPTAAGKPVQAPETAAPAGSVSVPAPPVPHAAGADGARHGLARGVNVVGYFRSEVGVGEAARQMVSALDTAGVPVLPMHGATIPLSRQGHAFEYLEPKEARYPVNIICMNADALPDFVARTPSEFFAGRYSAGLWFWEVSSAPPDAWANSFAALDEVWAPTRHIAETLREVSPIPVVQVRLPIEMPATTPLSRAALGLPDGFLFMFSFDYLSVFKRKNPLAVIDAYTSAFSEEEDVALVIKCINHQHDPEHHNDLLVAADVRRDIIVVDEYLDPPVKDALAATCDCYVSLHRSEGFGLTMAESMYQGKPVIATGYSGNMDFMTHDNSYPIRFKLVEIGDGAEPYPAEGVWAEPDIEHAAATMRKVFDDQDAARLRGHQAAASIRETHSARAAGEIVSQRLETIFGGLDSTQAEHPLVSPGLRTTVQRGPVAPAHSAAGPVGPSLRRATLRAVKPLSTYQDAVNEKVVASVEALDREVRRLGDPQSVDPGTLARLLRTGRDVARLRSELASGSLATDALRRDHDALAALHDPVVQRLDAMTRELQLLEAERKAVPYTSTEVFTVSENPIAGRVQGFDDLGGASGEIYRDFEDIFRGSEEFIRERQRRFLPLLSGHGPVLDFGCGRGEMLDLLREAEIPYLGVDSDAGMLDRCRAKGHTDVTMGDGIEVLGERDPESLGAVFSAQVIEHLPHDVLLQFFALSFRALAPGGVLIAETVNPHSPPALKTFWVDLTHQHPIFPETALSLVRSSGFGRAFIFHPNGSGDVGVDRYISGEYAVVATRVGVTDDRAEQGHP